MAKRIRVGLLFADPLMLQSRRLLLSTQPDFDIVFESAMATDVLEQIPELSVDVLVVDQRLRGSTGLDFAARMHMRFLGEAVELPKIVMSVPFFSDEILLSAIRAGSTDLVAELDDPEDLFEAIRLSVQADRPVNYSALREFFEQQGVIPDSNSRWLLRLTDLSSREQRVLAFLAQGMSDNDIAIALKLTATSIRWAVNALMTKLGVVTREQLALALYEAGLLFPGVSSNSN